MTDEEREIIDTLLADINRIANSLAKAVDLITDQIVAESESVDED